MNTPLDDGNNHLRYAEYVLGVLDVVLLAPVWLQVAHLLGADALWAALVVLTARLTLQPIGAGTEGHRE